MLKNPKLSLILVYFLLASFFFWRVLPVKVPLIVTDEVQYRLLAENLHRYGHFALRGYFPTTIAPLYSIILAVWEFIPLRPDQSAVFQSLNALLFASALFPLYLLARSWSFAPWPALGLATLCLLLPHSFYVATCMSENLYFPLALTFVYLTFLFLKKPRWNVALLLGVTGGAVLLTKSAGAFLLLSLFLLPLLGIFSHRKFLYFVPFILLLAFVLYFPWILAKHSALRSLNDHVLGAYSHNWQVVGQRLLSLQSVRMLVIYAADFVFATGFVSVPLVGFYWAKTKNIDDRLFVSYLLFLSLLLVGVAAIFSGLNTGWLRERHMFVLFPLYILCLFRAWFFFDHRDRGQILPWLIICWLLGALLLDLYDFRIADPTLESPWVHFVTRIYAFLWPSNRIYAHFSLYLLPIFVFLTIIVRYGRWWILTFWLLIFFLLSSWVCLSVMVHSSQRLASSPQGVLVRWVKREIGTGSRLLVTARHAYFEPAFLRKHFEARLVAWNESFFLRDIFLYRLEMAGLYDFRLADSVEEIRRLRDSSASYLLTALTFERSSPLAVFGPLRLYRFPLPVEILYQTTIDPRWFFTKVGERVPKGPFGEMIRASHPGWAVFGPYWTLPSGPYRATFILRCPEPSSLILDVYTNSLGTLAKKDLTCYQETRLPLDFMVENPGARYEFRVYLKQGDLIFEGVELSLRGLKDDRDDTP